MLPGNYESGQISWRRQEFTRFLNFLVEKKTKTKTNKIKNQRVVRTIALIFFFLKSRINVKHLGFLFVLQFVEK